MNKRRAQTPVMVIIFLFAVTFAVAFSENLLQSGTGGQFLPMAYATGDGLVKEVGDLVQFKAKIKNTGNLGSGYIVVVLWSKRAQSVYSRVKSEVMFIPLFCLKVVTGSIFLGLIPVRSLIRQTPKTPPHL